MTLGFYENAAPADDNFRRLQREAFGEKPEEWRSRIEAHGALRLPFPFARFENAEFVARVQGRQLMTAARRYQLDRSLVFTARPAAANRR